MIEFTYSGKVYEFWGEYRKPRTGESFLSTDGCVLTAWGTENEVRGIVHRKVETVKKVETVNIGGIIWEKLERQFPEKGEWVLSPFDIPYLVISSTHLSSHYPGTIIIPVGIQPKFPLDNF